MYQSCVFVGSVLSFASGFTNEKGTDSQVSSKNTKHDSTDT